MRMNDPWMPALLVTTAAYLSGSIPCGLLLARRFTRVDPRRAGSGNIGATNVARVAGPALGLATLAADVLKALLPVWAAAAWTASPATPAAAAVAAVLGHTFPIYSRFRGGGKGVATTAGGFLWIAPEAVMWAGVVFLAAALSSRRASVGSLAAALALPVAVIVTTASWAAATGAAAAAALIFVRHADNIRRLAAGTEPAFRFGRNP
jgi:glycerol-3-phosphate acyltransferase PlsY